MKSKESATGALQRRYEGVKRIMKTLSRRMIQLKIKGVQRFLEEMHYTQVLAFSELPPDVQYLVNTMKMVRDIQSRTSVYIGWVFKRLNPGDAIVMLKLFRRVISILVDDKDWDIGFRLTLAVNKVKKETDLYSPKNNLPSNPFYFVFKDVSDPLSTAYLSEPTASRLKIDQIVRRLGSKGVDILNLILTKSENSDVRTDAMETIVSMGEVARLWSLKILEKKDADAREIRNALAILREVGKANKDTAIVKKFMSHADPRIQEELLHTLMDFNAPDLESFIIKALTHSDDKLRWRAASALGKLRKLSKDSIDKILQTITSDPPDDGEQAANHSRKTAQLIQALGAVNNFPAPDRLEAAIIQAVQKSFDSGKGLMNLLKLSNPRTDQSTILVAAFAALGKIGSAKSTKLLPKFTKGKSPIAVEAQKAIKLIESRQQQNSAAQATV
jgi:HEAT repeat protein